MQEPQKLWFKAKDYGWGWQPSSWQGWLVLAVYLGFNFKIFWGIDSRLYSDREALINFFLPLAVSTVILLIVCYKKGEKPEWRWGKKK
ncbi:MAG: hypothetical protein A2563_00490 [Candidatus Magasanikbacteria bacterium RIFOXYD1_FULL_40_23]|uniref:Uncharacterized protein n=1 Tax=Candidatus Magasanikbacteria bacterium RIFOXYD1_FULL_40_23 TaxID=1798705 RepID=A0A1F6P7B0_9BACT|nr:MAG: hypothetical protein A2563_00490 [Candidatus Magasanikbacteria bacterium RIFOXYD1_FULL_40_23]